MPPERRLFSDLRTEGVATEMPCKGNKPSYCSLSTEAKKDKNTGLICDQTIKLLVPATAKTYPDKLRKVKYRDPETGKVFVFLSNNFDLPAKTIADLYKQRWQVELFFKWIKQNLIIKTFYGTSENAVKTQIWIAVSVYLLVAILKKRLRIGASLYTILQIPSVSVFERTELNQMLTFYDYKNRTTQRSNQLKLFLNYSGH